MELTIECQPREANSKPNALRRNGKIPAVLYGHKGNESVELTVNAKVAEFLVRDAKVGKTPINVSVPGLSWTGTAVLQEVQTHPWKPTNIYHLSFFANK
jgi:large subunit ribosomal protein L25